MKNAYIYLLLITLASQGALAFEGYIGCYKTLAVDGKPPSGPQELSTIEAGLSPVFYDFTRKRLNHIIINLYVGSDGNWKSYHPFVLFPDLGSLDERDNMLEYRLSEDVLFMDNYRPTRVDHNVNLYFQRTSQGLLKGHVSFRSSSRSLLGKRSFTLQPVDCFQ